MVFVLFAQQRVGELERNTDTGEMFVGIFAPRLVWIDDGVCVGIASLRVGDVVIGDDEVEPVLLRPCNRLKTPDAAVDTNDDRAPVGLRLL
jgi:hypothetical protein